MFADLRLQLGKLLPRFENLRVDTEGGDARYGEVFVPRLGRQCELPRHDGHDGFERHDIGMIADTRTRSMHRVIEQVASQLLAQYSDERLLGTGKEILPDATAQIIVAVVRHLLLVLLPTVPFHLCRTFNDGRPRQ